MTLNAIKMSLYDKISQVQLIYLNEYTILSIYQSKPFYVLLKGANPYPNAGFLSAH